MEHNNSIDQFFYYYNWSQWSINIWDSYGWSWHHQANPGSIWGEQFRLTQGRPSKNIHGAILSTHCVTYHHKSCKKKQSRTRNCQCWCHDWYHLQGSFCRNCNRSSIFSCNFHGRVLRKVRIKCNKCGSDNLDQGVDGKILCHNCKALYYLVATWIAPDIIRNIETWTFYI